MTDLMPDGFDIDCRICAAPAGTPCTTAHTWPHIMRQTDALHTLAASIYRPVEDVWDNRLSTPPQGVPHA